ncbi:MAG: response regulator [Desulfobacterales bacterium]|nr:response regulator [Desulfobacterales bacterium]
MSNQKSVILIVDNEAVVRYTLESMLISPEYNIIFAENGPQAIEKALEFKPDVILLDIMMPGMDGYEVCSIIRGNPILAEVPIILVTALEDHNSRIKGLKSGADDFLSKPVDYAELRARVQTIVKLNRYKRLLSERKKFESVVERANVGYLVVDSNDKIVYANPKSRSYLNISLDSNKFLEVAKNVYRCEPLEAWKNWPNLSVFAMKLPRYLVQPETLTKKTFWIKVDFFQIQDNERIIMLTDVTSEMTFKSDVNTFHSIISKKFQEPIYSIVSGLETLLKELLQKKDTDDFIRISNAALKDAHILKTEISSILKYIETDNIIRSGERFSLSMIRPMISKIIDRIELKSINIAGDEGLENKKLLFSIDAMEMIFTELISNSKKFHPKSSPIIEIHVISMDPKEVTFTVRDDGLTLSPEQIVSVWTPYYQGKKYFSKDVHGMGLGLSMVSSLIWSIGGTCSISNREDGSGVVVELNLPCE